MSYRPCLHLELQKALTNQTKVVHHQTIEQQMVGKHTRKTICNSERKGHEHVVGRADLSRLYFVAKAWLYDAFVSSSLVLGQHTSPDCIAVVSPTMATLLHES